MTSANIIGSIGQWHSAATDYRNALAEVPEMLELVADVCQAPMAALKVADRAQAHFAATWGIPVTTDIPRSRSLCDLVSAYDVTVIDDAARDPRVADHPLVSGSTQVNFIAAAPLRHHGHIVRALCVFDDGRRRLDADTTRRYLERLVRRVDAETGLRHRLGGRPALEPADRDDVMSTVSHELRTPLASIMGFSEMLAESPDAVAAPYAAHVRAIARNGERLYRTVDTLLQAMIQQGRERVGDRHATELMSVVSAFGDSLGPDGVRLRIDGPAEPVHVYTDPQLLRVAIGHLVSNALRFSPLDERVVLTVLGGPCPALEVHDRGPGLEDDEMRKLGTPFFRSALARSEEYPGLGLGLSVTDGILRAQGAELHFYRPATGGFTARIMFP